MNTLTLTQEKKFVLAKPISGMSSEGSFMKTSPAFSHLLIKYYVAFPIAGEKSTGSAFR